MSEFSDDPFYRDPELARFYDMVNGWDADFDYCRDLARSAQTVLDLGCGTGELAAGLGATQAVTGVDPAAAMLAIARARPGGAAVTWVEADARTVRLGRRFDLIVLTGHAFQVFLSDADQAAVFATMVAHLAPGGRFVFDSRNPADKSWERWQRDRSRRTLSHPELGPVESWTDHAFDAQTMILTYTTHYRVVRTGAVHSAPARIRYTPRDEIAAKLDRAGLAVETWLGDWHGSPYHARAKEIIPVGRRA